MNENQKIKEGAALILEGLADAYGLNAHDSHFKDTPARVARAYSEICRGLNKTENQVTKILSTAFEDDFNQMIIIKKIRTYSLCPHHLLPVEYDIDAAYIPDGSILGLSKIARICEILSARPIVQELLTNEIADTLMTIKPKGAAVYMKGKHFCMRMRGVKATSSVTETSAIREAFYEPEIRAEFFSMIKQ